MSALDEFGEALLLDSVRDGRVVVGARVPPGFIQRLLAEIKPTLNACGDGAIVPVPKYCGIPLYLGMTKIIMFDHLGD